MAVYFMRSGSPRSSALKVKIGFTAAPTPAARLKQLQLGNPDLVLIGWMPGSLVDEAACKSQWAHLLVPGTTEWIFPDQEFWAWLSDLQLSRPVRALRRKRGRLRFEDYSTG